MSGRYEVIVRKIGETEGGSVEFSSWDYESCRECMEEIEIPRGYEAVVVARIVSTFVVSKKEG